MRRWVIALAVASMAALLQPATAQQANSKRFDHGDHATKVKSTDGSILACDNCHTATAEGKLTKVGKKDHQPCKKCHGKMVMSSRELASSRKGKWCVFCHAKGDQGPSSFAVSYSHRTHTRKGGSATQCEQCHGTWGDAPPTKQGALAAGHDYCSGCHTKGAEPFMTSCAGCHSLGGTGTAVKARASNAYAVTGAFDHEKHANARRVGSEGRKCLTCHANITDAPADDVVPMPTMQGCFDNCHDSTKAFSVVGSTCTQCHKSGATAPAAGRATRYDHDKHSKLNVDHSDCTACHSLDASFAVKPATAGKNHAPCSNKACHANEFFAVRPVVCTTCHDGAAPWVKQPAFARQRKRSEFGRDISHATHAKGGNAACKSCHGDVYRGTAPANGHAACAQCHGVQSQPTMTSCAGCHGLGETTATASQTKTNWSVGANFDHKIHGTDPRSSSETSCVQCHANVQTATKVGEVANPTMPSCDGCHDGATAFKTTGFGCYRCHGDSQP